jgi:hypothetical protein
MDGGGTALLPWNQGRGLPESPEPRTRLGVRTAWQGLLDCEQREGQGAVRQNRGYDHSLLAATGFQLGCR